MEEDRMIKYTLDFINLIHLCKVTINEKKLKVTYYFDGKIDAQTFADQADFDEAVADIEGAGLLQIGEAWYNKDRLSIVVPNGASCGFHFIGNVFIDHEYADASEVADVIAEIEPTFVQIGEKWYQGKQIHVAKTNTAALTIDYDYLGQDYFVVQYDDQTAFDAAIDKLKAIGEGGGSGPVTKKVATPRLAPAGGNVTAGTTVTITCSTDGAAIHYTTDGTTPTASSPTYSSPIAVNADVTIKAIGVKDGMDNSNVASGSYVVVLPTAAAPVFTPAAGEVASGTEVSMASSTVGADIFYTTDGTTPTSASTKYTAPIAVTAATTFKAIAIAEGYQNSSVVTAAYTIGMPTAAAPTFTPNGGEVPKGSTVVLATTTPGGVIHYTTNGSTPTASSPAYTDPIVINANTTIKALTIADGYKNSSVASKSFTVPAVIEYYYAGIQNNPTEEIEDDHMPDPITQQVLEDLTNVDKGTATTKEYGSAGHEHVFTGIDEDKGGRVVYAYPKHLGALTSYITNGITGPIETSFTVTTIMCGDVEYYVYYLTDSTFNPIANYAFF